MSKFEEAMDVVSKKIAMPMAKISAQRHLVAIRNGVVAAVPLVIVGSIFLIIANPPIPEDWGFYIWATANKAAIAMPYQLSMGCLALYIPFSIGFNLAKSYKLDGITGGIIGELSFLLCLIPKAMSPALVQGITDDNVIPSFPQIMSSFFGAGSIFPAIFLSLLSVELYHFCAKRKLMIKMPDGVPPAVARSFESLIPVGLIMIIMTVLVVVAKLNLEVAIQTGLKPLVVAGGTLPGVLVQVFLICFFWLFGIHGDSIVGSVARPVWLQYIGENADAASKGLPLPHIAPEQFMQWFVWIGGSGATLGLLIVCLLFGKAKYTRTLSKACIGPGIFNINEPVIFGFPIMLNPIFFVPFLLSPLVMACTTWFAISLGMVSRISALPPWTLPAPIGAYITTGGDWRAIILCLVNIAISCIIFYPFMKIFDKQQLDLEVKAELEEANAASA